MKIISKKIGFFIVLAILLVIVGAFLFYVWRGTKEQPLYVETEDFSIRENNNIKIIENQKIGFSVEIPSDWKVEKSYDEFAFSTPDIKLNPDVRHLFPVPEVGCVITMAVKNDKNQYEYTEVLLKSCLEKSDCDYDIIKIDGINSLKHSSKNEEIGILNYNVSFLRNNKIYLIELYSNLSDKQNCSNIFDSFLGKIRLN